MKSVTNWILTCLLLGFVYCCGAQVKIIKPPENVTVCSGEDVTISCGYQSNTTLDVGWRIGNVIYRSDSILSSRLYQVNNRSNPLGYSLTIYSIGHNTTIQCIVQSNFSTRGTVTVIVPVIKITNATVRCTYIYLSWSNINSGRCGIDLYLVTLRYRTAFFRNTSLSSTILQNHTSFTIPDNTTYNVSVTTVTPLDRDQPIGNIDKISLTTPPLEAPNPLTVTADLNFETFVITVSWKAPECTGDIKTIMYNITVMDQYSPAIVTVPANMSSVEISQFPYNGTSIVANREYNITVSAISDQGMSYPSDPVVVSTFILHNCNLTSPSIGTIRVSCDSTHQILITLTCANCSNPLFITYGFNPLIIRMLDPGIKYSAVVNVFDGNQVVLRDRAITQTIAVMEGNTGNNCDSGDSNTGAIIGGIIGAAVVVIIIIIIIAIGCFVYYKRKDSVYDDKTSLQREPMLETSKSY